MHAAILLVAVLSIVKCIQLYRRYTVVTLEFGSNLNNWSLKPSKVVPMRANLAFLNPENLLFMNDRTGDECTKCLDLLDANQQVISFTGRELWRPFGLRSERMMLSVRIIIKRDHLAWINDWPARHYEALHGKRPVPA